MMINAMQFNPSGKLKRFGDAEREMLHLPAIIEDGKWDLETVGNLKMFPNKDRSCKLHMDLPRSILTDAIEMPMPYGKWLTGKVGSHVFGPNWTNVSFGIIPGDFWFSNNEFFFRGDKSPKFASSILVYADCPTWSFAGINNLPAFEFAPGLYGLLLPFNFVVKQIFTGHSVQEVQETMEHGFKMNLIAS